MQLWLLQQFDLCMKRLDFPQLSQPCQLSVIDKFNIVLRYVHDNYIVFYLEIKTLLPDKDFICFFAGCCFGKLLEKL